MPPTVLVTHRQFPVCGPRQPFTDIYSRAWILPWDCSRRHLGRTRTRRQCLVFVCHARISRQKARCIVIPSSFPLTLGLESKGFQVVRVNFSLLPFPSRFLQPPFLWRGFNLYKNSDQTKVKPHDSLNILLAFTFYCPSRFVNMGKVAANSGPRNICLTKLHVKIVFKAL